MKAKPKQETAIVDDSEYVATMVRAVRTHQTAAKMAALLGDVLRAIFALGVRRPTDWEFQWTGIIELRWHNGRESFSGSSRYVSLCLVNPDPKLPCSMRGQTTKGYDGRGGIDIRNISVTDAISMLPVLVRIIDQKEAAKDGER